MRKFFGMSVACLVTLLFAFTFPAQADNGKLTEGQEYAKLGQVVSTSDPAKIEVVEFFSYGCPHCNELNPLALSWEKKQPSDIVLKRVAVPWGPFYTLMSKFYYTLEVMGELDRLDSAVFDAIHNRGLRLINEKSLVDWVTSQGVDATKFTTAFRSFSVDSKVKHAEQLAEAARIEGVPALIVDGRYLALTKGIDSKSHQEMYATLLVRVDKIVEMRRKERNQKK